MPLRPHIVVIDPAVHTPELDCFNAISRRSHLPTTYHLPALHGFSSLEKETSGIAGLIILGSAASVYDQLAWQKPLEDWLRPHLQNAVPTLGCCYGHQLIGHLFGGKIDYLFPDKKKLLGFREVEIFDNRLWKQTLRGPLYVSHREIVRDLPKDFEIIAKSPEVGNDGMKHSKLPIWSFQSHPEATRVFAEEREKHAPNESQFQFGHSLVQSFLNWVYEQKGK